MIQNKGQLNLTEELKEAKVLLEDL